MKKTLILIFLMASTIALAQNRADRGQRMDPERMKAAKIAFLTEKLDLNSETAQKFWPIYNEFEGYKEDAQKEFMKRAKEIVGNEDLRNSMRNLENLNDDQARSMLKLMHERKEAEIQLERAYMDKFLEVLNPKQVLTVYQFDAEFRRTLMRRFSEQSRKRQTDKTGGN